MIPKTEISAMYGHVEMTAPPAVSSVMFVVYRPAHIEYCTLRAWYLGARYDVSMVATVRTGHAADPWASVVESARLSAQMATTWAKHRAELETLFSSIRAANAVTDEHRAAFARLWEAAT